MFSFEAEGEESDLSLQEMIDKLKRICIDKDDFMDEEEYLNCDKNLKGTGILSLDEIAEIVKKENVEKSRSHRRKNKDKKPSTQTYKIQELSLTEQTQIFQKEGFPEVIDWEEEENVEPILKKKKRSQKSPEVSKKKESSRKRRKGDEPEERSESGSEPDVILEEKF
jgi:hypothetical protein